MPIKKEASLILYSLEKALLSAGIISAKSDARCLLGLALGRDLPILPHESIVPISKASQDRLAAFIKRRINGEPISRIRGWREFWSLRFAVTSATLDPRPDSETVIESAIKWALDRSARNEALRCLDLGTGSGCLLLSLLTELPKATGVGVDLCPGAVATAKANAANLGLGHRAIFFEHSFTDDLRHFGDFDIILANPPYIPTKDIADLAIDVRAFEPRLALDGGHDGMNCWHGLLPRLAESLKVEGVAFVEIGKGQEASVGSVAEQENLRLIDSHCDLAGVKRCLQFEIKF